MISKAVDGFRQNNHHNTMSRKNIVVLTGAGISAESGIKTFRDADGLWEGHDVMEVASPQGWRRNPELVQDFYNQRRAQLHTVQPNTAHQALAELEQVHNVMIITQNVDDLHERAGSTRILHLHGELRKVRSTADPNLIYDWDKDVTADDKCELGSPLRPHIVWFGEAVPAIETAMRLCEVADILIIVGTSMQVYPAAGLIDYVPEQASKYYVDPRPATVAAPHLRVIQDNATTGVRQLVDELLANA